MKGTALTAAFLLLTLLALAQATITSQTVTSNGTHTMFTQNFSLPTDSGQEVTVMVTVRGQDGYELMMDSVYTTSGRTLVTGFQAAYQQKVQVVHCIIEPGESSCFETFLYGDNNGQPEIFWINSASDYDTTRIYLGWYRGLSGSFQMHGFVANAFALEDSGWAVTRQFDVANAPLAPTDSVLTVALPNSHLQRGTGLKFVAWATNEYGSSDTTRYWFQAEAYVGIKGTDKPEAIACYPNPSNGVFTLAAPDAQPSTVAVYNSMGERICVLYNVSGDIRVDLRSFGAGSYAFKIYNPRMVEFGRIMVR